MWIEFKFAEFSIVWYFTIAIRYPLTSYVSSKISISF